MKYLTHHLVYTIILSIMMKVTSIGGVYEENLYLSKKLIIAKILKKRKLKKRNKWKKIC